MDARIFLHLAVVAAAGYISVNGKPIPQGISADPNVQPAKESELMVSKCFLFPLNDALLYSRSCTEYNSFFSELRRIDIFSTVSTLLGQENIWPFA